MVLVTGTYIDILKVGSPADPSADIGRLYVKEIDANNDGLFIKVKRGTSIVEVQLV